MNIRFSTHKLNNDGLAHLVLPLVIVVGIAIVGTYMMVKSHADPLTQARAVNKPNGGLYYTCPSTSYLRYQVYSSSTTFFDNHGRQIRPTSAQILNGKTCFAPQGAGHFAKPTARY